MYLDRAMATEGMEHLMNPLDAQVDPTQPFDSAMGNSIDRMMMSMMRGFDSGPDEINTTVDVLAAVLDTTSGCPFTKDLLAGSGPAMTLLNAGGSTDGAEAAKQVIVYYTDLVPDMGKIPKYLGTTTFQIGNTGVNIGDVAEMTDVISTSSDPAAHINKTPGAPSRFTAPSLSAILMTDYSSTLATRDADATSLFCNAVPTLEMSRCVPFVNIIFVTIGKGAADGAPSEFGMMRFLGMTSGKEGTGDKIGLSSAMIAGITAGDDEIAGALDAVYEGLSSAENPLPTIFANGMEMFTSTQTYINADIGQGYYGGSYVVDRYRPLMSLESISITVTGLDNMMYARERAVLKILVHDRSRLQDVAPIIAADKMAMTHVVMEVGWAHPEGGDGSTNEYGRFLNEMRQKKLYNIASTTMSIRPDGQVSVTVTMAARGQDAMITVPVVTGKFVPTGLIRPQIEAFAAAVAVNQTGPARIGTQSPDILPSQSIKARSGGTAGSVIDREIFNSFLVSVGLVGFPGQEQAVFSSMKDIISEITDPDKVSARLATMKTVLKEKAVAMKFVIGNEAADPWRDPEMAAKFTKATSKDYFSFGKFVMSYVGYPLASSGQFDEVQVLFYPFNAQAALMHDKNIASFPIPYGEFKDVIDKLEEDSPGTNITAAFKTVVDKFLKNYSAEAYGMTGAYENYDEALKAAAKDTGGSGGQKEPELTKFLETVLAKIYETKVSKQNIFRPPLIKMYIESFPAINPPDIPAITTNLRLAEDAAQQKALTERSIDRSKVIARVHVFDYHSTPYESELLLTKVINQTSVAAFNTGGASTPEAVVLALKDMATTSSGVSHYVLHEAIRQGFIKVLETKDKDYKVLIPDKQNAAKRIKSLISAGMNNLLFGSEYSALKSAALTSNTSGPANQVILYNAITNKAKDGTQSGTADSLLQDVTVIPGVMNVTMLGCPSLQYGQQFFIDFQTGTTADNIYAATAITHTLRPGEFTTQCAFKFVGAASMSTFAAKIKQLERILESD